MRKQVLTHGVEEAEVLREQMVDGLKDELQEVVLHRVGSFTWDQVFPRSRHAEVFQGNR